MSKPKQTITVRKLDDAYYVNIVEAGKPTEDIGPFTSRASAKEYCFGRRYHTPQTQEELELFHLRDNPRS